MEAGNTSTSSDPRRALRPPTIGPPPAPPPMALRPGPGPDAMDPFDLLYLGWARRERRSFDGAWVYLDTAAERERMLNRIRPMSKSRAEDVVNDGFLDAMEEFDISITRGHFMCTQDVDGGGEPVLIGRVSGRRLGLRPPWDYRSEAEFRSAYRKRWYQRCFDRLRGPVLVILAILEESGEDPAASATTDPGYQLFAREGLLIEVEVLARFSEKQVRSPESRRLTEATLVFLKVRTALCNPAWAQASPQQIEAATMERLLQGAELSGFRFEGREWRRFLLAMLYDPPEEAPGEQKLAAAADFLRGRGGTGGSPPPEASCEAALAVCPDVVRSPKVRPHPLLLHYRECAGCRLALGEEVLRKQQRDSLDQRVKRWKQEVRPLLEDALARRIDDGRGVGEGGENEA